MKTTFEIDDIIYAKLKGSALKSAISGDIYRGRKPAGSKKEDVVIANLGINADQLQRGIVNVNIYVPGITVQSQGVQDFTVPNTKRMKELANIACGVLDDNMDGEVYYTVEQQLTIYDRETNEHFINIRVEYSNENF